MIDLTLWAFIGTLSGMVVGMIPGAGPFIATAVLYPFLQGIGPANIMMYYVAVLIATNYTNSVTAIIYGIPGDAAAIVTAREGHRFFKRGMGAVAVSSNAISSTIGVVFAVSMFLLVLPNIIDIFRFYNSIVQTLVIAFAIVLITAFTKQSKLLSSALFIFGGAIAHIGLDPITYESWGTFGISYLTLGIPFSVVMIGLYIVPEITKMGIATEIAKPKQINKYAIGKNTLPSSLIGSFVGFWCGMVPGITNILGSYVSAEIVKRLFKAPVLKSIAAAEAANNSGALSSLLPLLILAIPITGSEVLIYYLMMEGGFEFNVQNAIGNLNQILYLVLPVSFVCLAVSWYGFNLLSDVAYFYKKYNVVANIIILTIISAVSLYVYPIKVWFMICLSVSMILGYVMRRWDTTPIIYGYFLSDLFYENLVRTLAIIT
jgi:putative tricarboxylic transport membrane protein